MLKWAILASFTHPHVVFNQYDLKRLFLNWLMKVNREELWKLISAMDLKYKKVIATSYLTNQAFPPSNLLFYVL